MRSERILGLFSWYLRPEAHFSALVKRELNQLNFNILKPWSFFKGMAVWRCKVGSSQFGSSFVPKVFHIPGTDHNGNVQCYDCRDNHRAVRVFLVALARSKSQRFRVLAAIASLELQKCSIETPWKLLPSSREALRKVVLFHDKRRLLIPWTSQNSPISLMSVIRSGLRWLNGRVKKLL